MDFRVKSGKQGRGGLWMDLLPGRYIGAESFDQTIRVHEDAFWFLEPSIKKHSRLYARPYSHWGATTISRTEWENILREWEDITKLLQTAVIPLDLKSCARFLSMCERISSGVSHGTDGNFRG